METGITEKYQIPCIILRISLMAYKQRVQKGVAESCNL